ncbi:MAG: glycosyltransferase family 61 protein [Pikeienuella sp.]
MMQSGVIVRDGAVVVPPLSRETVNQTGVLVNGAPDPAAITYRGGHTAHDNPPDIAAQEHLPGSWLWAGPLYWHFGHFLTESITRLWAYDAVRQNLDGVIFTPKRYGAGAEILPWQAEFLEMAGIGLPTRVLTRATAVERLIIPAQGFGTGKMIGGTGAFRHFVQTRFAKDIPANGPERLYLSRSKFGPRKGGLLGEVGIESHLAAEGYEIFHPQNHTLQKQIAMLKAAKRIIGADGSAFHLAGLVARRDVRAAMVMRRNAITPMHLIGQFEALRGAKLHAINAIRQDWTPNGAPPDRLSYAELDFAVLSRALRRLGLIDREGWAEPTPESVTRRIRQLSRRRGVSLMPVRPEPRITF